MFGKGDSKRYLARAGGIATVAGALLVMMPAGSVAQAHGSAAVTASAPSCAGQPNRSDPTNSDSKVLDSYWFAVNHAGHTSSVCTLFGHVQSGDIVTAHLNFTTPARASSEVTLASYTAVASASQHQTLFTCSSYGVAPDPAAADSCVSSATADLTVTIPTCGVQVDLVYGEALPTLTEGAYTEENRWIDGQQTKGGTCATPTPTPTATPTPTPTATPTPGGGDGTSSPTAAGGVQALTTPSTGADLGSPAPLGLLMMLVGGAAVAYARRHRGNIVP